MPEHTAADSTDSVTFKKSLPPVRSLIEDAWKLFTQKVLKILLLVVVTFVAYALFFVIAGAILFSVGLMNVGSVTNINDVISSLATGGTLTILVILALAFMVLSIVFSYAVQAAYLLLLDDPTEETSVIEYIKRGVHFVWPLLIASLIMMFIVLGSFMLFIIPGIIVAIFFVFTTYAVVLDKKTGVDALRFSAGIVSQHFGAILGRLVLFFLFAIVGQALFSSIGSDESAGLMVIPTMIINTAIGWYGMAYIYLLYKQAREVYDPTRKTSLTWMWIVAIVGYVVGAFLLMGIARFAQNVDVQDALKNEFEGDIQYEGEMEYDSNFNYEYDAESEYNEEYPTSEEFDELLQELQKEEFIPDEPPV